MSIEGKGGSEVSEVQSTPESPKTNEVSPEVDKRNNSELGDVNKPISGSDAGSKPLAETHPENERLPDSGKSHDAGNKNDGAAGGEPKNNEMPNENKPLDDNVKATEPKSTEQPKIDEQSDTNPRKPSWNDIATPDKDGSNIYHINDRQGEGDGNQRNLLNGELPKNATIKIPLETLPMDFDVKTDDLGRVSEFNSPKVDFFNGDRSGYQQGKAVEEKDGLRGNDDGGHLYPREWGGPREQINLVPMDSHVNRSGGDWRNMEQDINRELEKGNDVTDYSVKPLYEGDSRRPSGFEISYSVNGEALSTPIKINNYIDNPKEGAQA